MKRNMKLVRVEVPEDVEQCKYQVVDKKDNFVWSESGSARGAIRGVLAILGWNKGVLNKIDFFDFREEVGFFKL